MGSRVRSCTCATGDLTKSQWNLYQHSTNPPSGPFFYCVRVPWIYVALCKVAQEIYLILCKVTLEIYLVLCKVTLEIYLVLCKGTLDIYVALCQVT